MAVRGETDSRSGAMHPTDGASGNAFLARLLVVVGFAAVAFLLWSFLMSSDRASADGGLVPDAGAARDPVKPATHAVAAAAPPVNPPAPTASEPATHTVTKPAAPPVSPPAAPTASEPATHTVTKPAARAVSAPAAPPISEPVTHRVTESAALPVASPSSPPVSEPAAHTLTSVTDAVAKPAALPVIPTVVQTGGEPATRTLESVTNAATEPVTTSVTDALPAAVARTIPAQPSVVDALLPRVADKDPPELSVVDALLPRVASATGAQRLEVVALVARVAGTTAAQPSVIDGLVPTVAEKTKPLLEVEVVETAGLQIPPLLKAGSGLVDQLGGVVTTAGGLGRALPSPLPSFASAPSLRSFPSQQSSAHSSLPSAAAAQETAAQGTIAHELAAGVAAHALKATGVLAHALPLHDSGNGPVEPAPVAPAPVLPTSAPQPGAGGNGSHDVSAVIRAPWGGPGSDATGYWQQGPERATSRSDWPLDRPG